MTTDDDNACFVREFLGEHPDVAEELERIDVQKEFGPKREIPSTP